MEQRVDRPQSIVHCVILNAVKNLKTGILRLGLRMTLNRSLFLSVVYGLWTMLFLSSCTQDMKDNSRLKPYEASIFFADGKTERPLVEGTVPYGSWPDDTVLNTGKENGKLVDSFPFKVTPEVLARGRERYNIYCIVCHGASGNGDGMVARRGFKPAPASFHTDRLRKVPAGYFFDVMTNGFGAMADYRAQVEAEDRWAIAAYIRALQLSQNAVPGDVPDAQKMALEKKA